MEEPARLRTLAVVLVTVLAPAPGVWAANLWDCDSASDAVCGFRVAVDGSGPQLAFTQKPPSCLMSLRKGEEYELVVCTSRLRGRVSVTADVSTPFPGEAEVCVKAGAESTRARLAGADKRLTLELQANGEAFQVALAASARSDEVAVRWANVRLAVSGGPDGEQSSAIPLWPPRARAGKGAPRVLPALRKPIEEALIEWDWRMQDGIGTERFPRTYAEAVERVFARGDALIAELTAGGIPPGKTVESWRELRRAWRALTGAGNAGEAGWEELWREAHRLRRRIALENPSAKLGPLVFVKHVPGGIFSHQLTQYYGSCARPGGGVFVLDAPGKSMACRQLAAGQLPEGSCQHLDVSYDGKRVLFAYCHAEAAPKDREEHLERVFQLYEMLADGSGLRRLTDGRFDDFAPRYLPDGRILFVSTRRGGFHRCGRGPCPVYTLALAEPDGSNPRAISYHETHEWDPAVLNDGRVVYTRWDYVDRNAVQYQQLWTVRPDGSDVRICYGNNTLNPVGVWEARAVPRSSRIMATAAAHHAMTAGSIILVDPTRGVDGLEPLTRLTPDALFPESEVAVSNGTGGAWGRTEKKLATPDTERWPGHSYRAPFPLSEKHFLASYSYEPLIGEPSPNAANMFGLYLVDCFGNKELLYRDLNLSSLWAMPLEPRERPPVLQGMTDAECAAKGEGLFFLQNVYEAWPELPKVAVKRLRLVQVLPKTTPHINTPTVGIPNASPGKQVLGTVPVEEDGSAFFRAPAGIPLAFQALDEHGRAVQMMRSITYLQRGEMVSCAGCHEQRTTAPALARTAMALALARGPSVITPGPDGSKPLSYPLLVQPVLDRKCVSCHNPAKPDGGVVLTGAPQKQYTVSYNALAPKVPYSAWGAPHNNCEPATKPDYFGARGCKLMTELIRGHQKVVLTAEEIERLATWMDANALFYGTFDPADQTRQQRGERIAGPKLE